VRRRHEAGVGQHLLDRRLLGALGGAVVAGGLGLAVVVLAERPHNLIMDVVDDVAANRRHALGGVNVHVHRPFSARARGLAEDAGHQFDGTTDFEVEKAERAFGVQAVDQMLDVGRWILRMHEAGHRIFEFAPIDDYSRIHRKEIILAGVVDVEVGVQHEADVAHAHAVLGQPIFDHVLMELQSAHAQSLHDLVRAVAGVDENRIGAAENEKSKRRHAAGVATIAAEDKELDSSSMSP
jgi:hypothetical protein